MIRKVYIILKPSEINEALDFMSQEDGIYHHDFMETHGKADQCFICGKPPKNHINYEPKNNLIEKLRDSIGHTSKNENSDDEKLKLKYEDSKNKAIQKALFYNPYRYEIENFYKICQK